MAINWQKKKRVREAGYSGNGKRLGLILDICSIKHIIYESGKLSREPDIRIWNLGNKLRWKYKWVFVSISMAYKTIRWDEIAKGTNFDLKKITKSSRIEPYRDLGDN